MKGKRVYDIAIIVLLAALAVALQGMRFEIAISAGTALVIDLVAVPALLAFFLYGFRESFVVLLLTCIGITFIDPMSWLGASMKLAGTLPMIAIPAFYVLSTKKGFAAKKLWPSAFFALFIALFAFVLEETYFGAASQVEGFAIGYGSPHTPPITEVSIPLGNLLLGLLPIVALFVFALVLLKPWKHFAKGVSPLMFEQPRLLAEVLLVAVFIRGATIAVSSYYFGGPIFYGFSPEWLMTMVPWYILFLMNAVQGALEMFIAWFILFPTGLVERYSSWE